VLVPLLVGYVTIVAASFFALVRSVRTPASFSVPMRLFFWVVVVAQSFYMLGSPACVYLPPRAVPPAPAVEKVLVGNDGSGQLHWLEGKSPIAFAWGPRWWFRVGHAPNAGVEFTPPVRFALLDATQWELVGADGSREMLSIDRRNSDPRAPTYLSWHRALRSDGNLLSWDSKCLRSLTTAVAEPKCLAELDSNRRWAVAVLPQDHTLEILRDEAAFQNTNGRVRDLTLVERDAEGHEVRRVALRLPTDETKKVHYQLHIQSTSRGLMLVEAWSSSEGSQGRVYRVTDDLLKAEPHGVFPVRLSLSEEPSFAISSDGEFLTTGQAVFRTNGEPIQDIDPPLWWCRWTDRRLYGVRRYPFVGFAITNRAYAFNAYLRHTRAGVSARWPRSDRSAEELRKGIERSAWLFGGLDEAGREDEIVEVPIP